MGVLKRQRFFSLKNVTVERISFRNLLIVFVYILQPHRFMLNINQVFMGEIGTVGLLVVYHLCLR
jgi:hypothetical protein